MGTQRALTGFSVFYDGVDYLGVASAFTPPMAEAETVTMNQPGHAGPLRIPTGRLAGDLEAQFTMGDCRPDLEALVASPTAADRPLVFILTGVDGGREQRTVEHEITGVWVRQEPAETGGRGGGQGRDANAIEVSYRVSVRTWTHRVDGAEVRHVDIEQGIHRVGGTDVLEDVRTALRRS